MNRNDGIGYIHCTNSFSFLKLSNNNGHHHTKHNMDNECTCNMCKCKCKVVYLRDQSTAMVDQAQIDHEQSTNQVGINFKSKWHVVINPFTLSTYY